MAQPALKQAEQTIIKTLPDWVWDCIDDATEDRTFWITKGLGAGGTYGLGMWHYLKCLQNIESRFSWAIAPTFQQVADTLIPTFTEVFTNFFGLEEFRDFDIIQSGRPRIVLKRTRQEIHFKSANRPDRLVGPSISHISGTEVGLWPRMAYEKSSARLRCPRAKSLQTMGEGTPEGFNWWQKEADLSNEIDEERNYRRVILHTSDNTFLKPGYVDRLIQTYEYDPAKLESYLYGRFVTFTKGSAYWEFHESRNVALDIRPSPFLPVRMCWDFGVSPLPWVAIQRQPVEKFGHRHHRFVALAEGTGKARGLMDACAEFVSWFDPKEYGETPIEIDGGHDGYFGSYLSNSCAYDQILQYLKKYYRRVSIVAARKAPDIKDRLERCNALFAYDLYVMAAWCRNLIHSHRMSSLKDGTWELEKKRGEDPTHFADAASNALFNLTKDMDLENQSRNRLRGLNLEL